MKRLFAFAIVFSSVTAAACGGASGSVTTPTLAPGPPVESNATKRFVFGGMVTSVDKPTRYVKDALIEITSGPNKGQFVVTDADGSFVIRDLMPGAASVRISKMPEYQTQSKDVVIDRDLKLSFELFLDPPTDANGVAATGRCNDASWSWAKTLPEACTANGGIAYGVCPGPLCKSN